jgi:hypothetical protein
MKRTATESVHTCTAHPSADCAACLWLERETEIAGYRRALERIMDVAERYQENKANLACAGLGNCYRFAKRALEK